MGRGAYPWSGPPVKTAQCLLVTVQFNHLDF
jgi:hypothetical protein